LWLISSLRQSNYAHLYTATCCDRIRERISFESRGSKKILKFVIIFSYALLTVIINVLFAAISISGHNMKIQFWRKGCYILVRWRAFWFGVFLHCDNFQTKLICGLKLEIRFVERCICPIATLYSLAATYKGGSCKQGTIIFHGGRVVVIFVAKFIAMATGVGRGEILTTPSDSLDSKIGGVGANSTQLSFTGTELYHFEISIGCDAKFCNFWMVAMATAVIRVKFKWRH